MKTTSGHRDEAEQILRTAPDLTEAQQRALRLLANGRSLAEAGKELGVSRQAVLRCFQAARSKVNIRTYRTAQVAQTYAQEILLDDTVLPSQRAVCERVAAVGIEAASRELGMTVRGLTRKIRISRRRLTARELQDVARYALEHGALNPKQREALVRVAEHGNVRQASREAGASPVTIHAALKPFRHREAPPPEAPPAPRKRKRKPRSGAEAVS